MNMFSGLKGAVEGGAATHDWRYSGKLGGQICADCGAVHGSRRGGLPCGTVVVQKGHVTTGVPPERVAALWQEHYMQPQAFAQAVLAEAGVR